MTEHHEQKVGHVVPMKLLLGVASALLVLTAITVYTATQVDLGGFNIWLALAIAMLKASLVCMYFMHLRWDSPFNLVVLMSSFIFVVLFIGFSLTDTSEYQPDMDPTFIKEPSQNQ